MIETLRRDGIAQLGQLIPPDDATLIAEALRASPRYPGHVKVYGDGVSRPSVLDGETWTHDLRDVLALPAFWELVLANFDVAAQYLETDRPRLYSLNAYWAGPVGLPLRDLQTWHRDKDDARFLALFVYGTDVLDEAAGPHRYMRGTHGGRAEVGPIETIFGPAGTAFLADTSGFHMGMKPRTTPRLLLWARWGVSDVPAAYEWDKTTPVDREVLGDRYPTDERLQSLISLIVK